MPRATTRNADAVRFGEIIRRLRTQRGWSLVKFSQRSGMNPTYLGQLERGANMVSMSTLLEFAEIFNVEAADLVREVEQARRRAAAERFA